ncbi:hypothetical protein OIU85_026475 [Salix viminalis]|uniref:Uncharacterized protein n=1 Tax=Salix viminalis TaxID=40686 RepID=A0A9Q0YYU8_SALVM|nr:hypothetical protein OIU85_026475 [Salix viminalis]
MSAAIISDPMVVSASETQAAAETTVTKFIAHNERAIKDEIIRTERLISTEEAMTKHMNFCRKFVSSGPPPDPTIHLIAAMRQILRRSLDSPRGLRSTPSSPTKTKGETRAASLTRSESCFPTLSG